MGDFLTKPITEKNSVDGKNERFLYGACSMQGWRKSNEDAHIHEHDIGDGNAIFAVFDGHGGEQVALFCEKYMISYLMNNEEYKCKNYQKALEETFVELDYLLINEEGHEKMKEIQLELKRQLRGPTAKLDVQEEREIKSLAFQAGCTSVVCLITQDAIYCANSGDSRAVLATKAGKVIELSHDHKPENDGEMARVKAAGGFVEEGRVQGVIAVSRAIGDWEYKNPGLLAQMEKKKSVKKVKSSTKESSTTASTSSGGPYRNIEEAKKHQVSSFPDVKKVALKPEHDFMIVACDGIWDCFTNEQAVKFVRNKREKGPRNGIISPTKLGKQMKILDVKKLEKNNPNSPLKIAKAKSESLSSKKLKIKGETSYIIEEMMNQGIAKGDISMSDGTGTDNMTCIIVQFRDPNEAQDDQEESKQTL